jgi:NAD(P)-dependent dehydrogenase (short-subunit alcohol dehydrogenase family)
LRRRHQRDDANVETAVLQVLGDFGRVDILVNCAAAVGGQGKPQTLAEVTNEPFFADMNVKVAGTRGMRRACSAAARQSPRRANPGMEFAGARHGLTRVTEGLFAASLGWGAAGAGKRPRAVPMSLAGHSAPAVMWGATSRMVRR